MGFKIGPNKIGPNEFFIKARVIVPNPDPRKPREDRRAQEHFRGSKSAADDRYLEIRRELRNERKAAGIFRDLLESYRTSRGGDIPRSQVSIYTELDAELGPVALCRLTVVLPAYYAALRRMPSKTTGEKLANGSINRRRAMLAAAINLANEMGTYSENPLTKANWPKLKETPRDRRLTPLEVQRLMETVREHAPHLEHIFWFALRVPCRKAELVNMGPQDLDLFNNAIRVHNGTTKNDMGSWKPIPDEMKAYFRAIPPESPVLFFRKVGELYFPLGDFKKAWGRCLALAGIQDFRFHDTRHIAATNLVNAGMSERDVMKIAGWNTNMLSTYWGSSSMESVSRTKFLPESALVGGNTVATARKDEEKSGDSGAERAVI